MAKKKIQTSPWKVRIDKANAYYKKWADRFRCDVLEDYYEGFQWQLASGSSLEANGIRRPYTVNLVFSTIKRKIGNITYSYPEFILTPLPGQMNWNQEIAVRSAALKQDTLNTVITNPSLEFVDDIRLAALDSFFRFAVIETGYGQDWWNNPNAPKVEMASHEDPTIQPDDDSVESEEKADGVKTIFTRWIDAKRFRVSMADSPKLRNCDWVGYYEYIPTTLLKNTKGINYPEGAVSGFVAADFEDAKDYLAKNSKYSGLINDINEVGALSKVWRIWDNVAKKKLLILDGNFEIMYEEPFERLPFSTYRGNISLKGWYPIPPVWQWLSPQNEVNEAREQMRKYRRHATRKFEVSKGDHEEGELDKLSTDVDGEVIVTKNKSGNPTVRPIQNPQVDNNILDGLVSAKDDFDIVAGIPVARGRASDRQTATATRMIAADQSIIEDLEQIDFSQFVAAVGREVLLTLGEKMDRGIWVKMTLDPGNQQQMFEEMQDQAPVYDYITSQDLQDGYDFSIKVNVVNATPAQMIQEKQSYIEFLALTTQYPQIALSPILIRETAYRTGYKNEKVIREMQKQAMLAMLEKANMAGQSLVAQGLLQGGTPPNGQAQGIQQRQLPNSVAEVQAQLTGQVGE